MALLPPRHSPRWLLVFVVTALVWTAAMLGAGYLNHGQAPTPATVGATAKVIAAMMGVLALLGYAGARAAFLGAQLGLLVGLALMVSTFVRSDDGMADLGAVAGFLIAGAVGLAVGLLVDLVRRVRRSRQGT